MRQQIDAVVIDGGGTGTRLRAVGADGATLAETTSGPSSLTLGVEQAWRNVAAGLDALATTTGSGLGDARLVCGFAGGRSPDRQARFRALAGPVCADIVIVTDGFASLLGAHGGRPGVVLAVGTGVAAYALGRDGRVSSASAWGFAIGDEGSGAWIGRRAVSLLSRHLDGRLPGPSALFEALRPRVGGDFNAIQTWLSDANATRFATLAPVVIDAAAAGDDLAAQLIDAATEELETAIAAIDDGGPVSLLGGLAPVFAPRLSAPLAARLTPARGNALDGLVLMQRRGWRDEVVPELERQDG
ncbi:BadF/BadG/BcrA/BcrD ATPase family protein [Citreimonas salinaria]|uniref:Glucosamine kinase n=1 Tax=Citreimonas salinaria TaxID=321339 RepID=A0A1H3MKP2_9RHOB|nr:BadF/BadG/BcrA/BcrD ATPase family protein [Citreimonas salinaria]SDY77146.1 glucosamine kinase [Citreimonas salinaria]